jgi:hypothetical protein
VYKGGVGFVVKSQVFAKPDMLHSDIRIEVPWVSILMSIKRQIYTKSFNGRTREIQKVHKKNFQIEIKPFMRFIIRITEFGFS